MKNHLQMKKATYLLVLVLALLSAAVQYNDPDPLRWMAMYGYVAVLYGLALAGRYWRAAVWAGMAVAALWAATMVPGFVEWVRMGMPSIVGQMKAESPHVELVREFLGLLLCLLALAGLWYGGPVRRSTS